MLIQETQQYEKGGIQHDVYSQEDVIDVSCPCCGTDKFERVYTEHEVLGIVRCCSCELVYTTPRLKSPESNYWGDKEAFYREARLIFEGRAKHHRDPTYQQTLDIVERFTPRGKLLDVGSNTGMLLRFARNRGWEVTGVEPSKSLATLSHEQFDVPVFANYLSELPQTENKKYDVLTMTDVFEHVSEPLDLLADVRRLLKPEGCLYIRVPNAKWNIFKQRGAMAMGRQPLQGIWDAGEHVVHYTDRTLRTMLERGGFQVIDLHLPLPVQVPVWHLYVGHYYQYPSPWHLDWKRHFGRTLFYWLGRMERIARMGSVGYLPPAIGIIAKPINS